MLYYDTIILYGLNKYVLLTTPPKKNIQNIHTTSLELNELIYCNYKPAPIISARQFLF